MSIFIKRGRKMCKRKYNYGFIGGIDSELFKLQYNESAKVIDFCKQQQWYVAGLGVAINYGLITICQSNLNVLPPIKFLILLIMLVSTILIPVFGSHILHDLVKTTSRHRGYINLLKNKNYIDAPCDLKKMFTEQIDLRKAACRDCSFMLMMLSALIVSSLICSLIIFSSLIVLFSSTCLNCL
jgi:hypothetical protein